MPLRSEGLDPRWIPGLAAFAIPLGLLAGVDPRLGVGAAFGLLFIIAVVGNMAVGLSLFAALSFVDTVQLGGGLTFSKAIGLLLVVAWLASRRDGHRDFLTDHPAVVLLMILLVGWVALSVSWAEAPQRVLGDLLRLAPNLLLFPIVYTVVQRREHVIWVLSAFVIGALLSMFYGLAFAGQQTLVDDAARLTGAGGEANELATTLAAGIILGLALAVGWKRSPGLRLLALGASGVALAGLMATVSRTGLIALAAGLAGAVLVGGRWRPLALVTLAATAAATVIFFSSLAPPEVTARVTSSNTTGRADLWLVARRMVEDKPLTGVGAGNFQVASIHYLIGPGVVQRDDFIIDTPKAAHNVYLELAATLGIVGLAMFVGLLAFSLRCTVRAARSFGRLGDGQMDVLCRGVLIALVAMLVSAFFQPDVFSKQLWLLLALGPALAAIANRATDQAGSAPRASSLSS